MAASHTFNDQVFASSQALRPEQGRKARNFATGVALATGAFLAIAPVAVTAIVPDRAQPAQAPAQAEPASDATLVAYTGRAVELDGAIMGFRQDGLSINLSVMAADDGQRIFVQDANGELFQIPVSPGQTNVSADLPAHFAASDTLTFRVD